MREPGWWSRRSARRLVRAGARLALAVWLGGFTFYGGVVVPIYHRHFTTMEVGLASRDVTDALNALGLVALVLLALDAARDRRRGLLVALAAALLAALVGLHEIMDARIDAGAFGRFYPLHRAYLTVHTALWAVQVVLLLRREDDREP
jgi:NAD/NADP transhydrogenase beta subunit